MDELTFRRHAYENPNSTDPEFLAAKAQTPENQALVDELISLDNKLINALKIDPPENMAEKLLLKQNLSHFQQQRKRNRAYIAIAASVAFVAGISTSLWQQHSHGDIYNQALAHLYYETAALESNGNINYQAVNAKLASFSGLENIQFNAQPGIIDYNKICDFEGSKSLHLVMSGKQGKVTIFIVPQSEQAEYQASFADNTYQGETIKLDSAYMLMLAKDKSDIDLIKKEVIPSLI